jgi:predicted membrane metal-binding protein
MSFLIEVIGWSAAVLILVAYGLLSTGRLEARSVTYQAMNIAGAAGFMVNSGWNGALPSAALNVVWMMIGVYALWRNRPAH